MTTTKPKTKRKPHRTVPKRIPVQLVGILIATAVILTLLAVNGYSHTRYCKAVSEKTMCVMDDKVYTLYVVIDGYTQSRKGVER